MSATITDADRTAAHALCGLTSDGWCSWIGDRNTHGEQCTAVAQAIADARAEGRKEEHDRDDYHSRKHFSEALTWIEQNLDRNQCSGIALVARALIAADELLAARRSR